MGIEMLREAAASAGFWLATNVRKGSVSGEQNANLNIQNESQRDNRDKPQPHT